MADVRIHNAWEFAPERFSFGSVLPLASSCSATHRYHIAVTTRSAFPILSVMIKRCIVGSFTYLKCCSLLVPCTSEASHTLAEKASSSVISREQEYHKHLGARMYLKSPFCLTGCMTLGFTRRRLVTYKHTESTRLTPHHRMVNWQDPATQSQQTGREKCPDLYRLSYSLFLARSYILEDHSDPTGSIFVTSHIKLQ